MIDFQSVFYGVCGLLVAIAITQPKFYVKYAVHLLIAAFFNAFLVLLITAVALRLSRDVASYGDGLKQFAINFSDFLLKVDNYQTASYMGLLIVVWGNMCILSLMLSKHGDETGRL